ncbi:hypothetical protein [Parvibium lacunae]|uniref:hypothetical protein n=1 Tax=Parvibium lacunae TaxID=1888893 RepID=UPI0011C03439|nr:hypothetical protein [Parvibium lacunae]
MFALFALQWQTLTHKIAHGVKFAHAVTHQSAAALETHSHGDDHLPTPETEHSCAALDALTSDYSPPLDTRLFIGTAALSACPGKPAATVVTQAPIWQPPARAPPSFS